MSNPLTEARDDAAAALGDIGGVKVFTFIPKAMTAPAVTIRPGNPYVMQGTSLGDYEVTLIIRLYAAAGSNEVITTAMDDLIVSVLEALEEWTVESVGDVAGDPDYGADYLTTDITIKSTYRKER